MSRDASILENLRKGSKEAFSEIYYQYKNLVFYLAYDILNNKSDADDIVSETYLRFMKNLDKLKPGTNIKNMLCAIGRNLAIDQYRRNTRRASLEDNEFIADSTEEKPSESEMLITLNKVLEPEEAKLITLHVIYDYTFSELAKQYKTTVGVVQAKYYKVIKKLKEHYSRRN